MCNFVTQVMKTFFQILLVVVSVFLSSCLKTEDYPIEPQISFKNYFIGYKTTELGEKKVVAIIFSFTDGDGDIGLGDGDTLPPFDRGGKYYYNLVITMFKKNNGVFTEVVENSDSIVYSGRISTLPSVKNKKAIKGDIEDDILPDIKFSTGKDTVKYNLFIYDRALHKSNVITTPEIVL